MPRLPREVFEVSFFHIMVQGINREYIFDKNEYMKTYKSLMLKYSEKYKVTILAYCIMNNHAHILVYVERPQDMSEFMRSVNTTYGHYYNKLEKRVGIVFRNRYVSQPIYNEKYLYSCIAYIHNNPVKAKIIKNPSEYIYSSYNEYINRSGVITEDVLKILFGTGKEYLDIFTMIKEDDVSFVDCEKELENTDIIIKEYCEQKKVKIKELLEDKKMFIGLLKHLITEKKITQTEVANKLKINRIKICRLMKELK